MRLSALQALCIIALVAAGTQLTRWVPFWLFPEHRQPPPVVTYLGRVLPPAMMGLLVVYCLKGVSWSAASHGVPELSSILLVAALHRWKGNVLLSIAGGTGLYMLLVQLVFA
ncbi:branched-chain amino acid transporter permease [Oscillibacter sp.]|uniref:branched-chain amino acid transporter permease n=1 Tax=Oscillibacter sp. TaxID=1945593 RepID=UPI0026131593|nr:branched-chain amino acid transporter permease [Oscillibacter sp.]MDD3347055.1 branched-chain amino acid transporter permease [Oscillibacter sp.]